MTASAQDKDRWSAICRLREALRTATGPRFDRQWDNVVTDIAPEVMRMIDEARGYSGPTAAPSEPLTGGDADINVRVRVNDKCPDPWFAGRTGTLLEYESSGGAVVRFDTRSIYTVPVGYIERAPAECPHCGASQVAR